MPGTFASIGPFDCVLFSLSIALMWKPAACGASARKIVFMDASRAHCQADATSEMAIELPPEEHVKGEDVIGELLKSLYGTRRAAHNWEKKRQKVLLGFAHGDDFIFRGDSMRLAWAETRVNGKLILKRRAILGPDDGDDKTVTILNRLVTWVFLSGSRNQKEIEADPRHREILLAQMNLDGANVKLVVTLVVKVQEWTPQMLTKLDKDRASTFGSATMRASRVDKKEVARFRTEQSEGTWSKLKRLARYVVGYGRLVQVTEAREGTTRGHRQRSRWMRANQEEHDVCSSFSRRQLAQSRKLDTGCAQLECCLVGVLRKSQRYTDIRVHHGKGVVQDGLDTCIVRCYGCESHREMKGRAQHGRHRHEGGDCSSASETFEDVGDGMARWTSSAGVECGASAVTA